MPMKPFGTSSLNDLINQSINPCLTMAITLMRPHPCLTMITILMRQHPWLPPSCLTIITTLTHGYHTRGYHTHDYHTHATVPMPGHGYHTHATIPMPDILYSTLYTEIYTTMINYRIIPLLMTNYRIIPLFLVMGYDSVVWGMKM